jgi:CheY-like chemotaxis protein/GGDEF domain-containing protein
MGRGRILAVDDQRYFRELIEGLLVEEGYEVQTCGSGEEALQVLDHAAFDVIVTDLVMPGMNGCDLVQRVKERDPEQEIMVVTGVVDVRSAVDAMKVGATDYLLKPFDRVTLASALDSILQRSRLRQERDRLLAENIEYLGERSLFERALALFTVSSIEALSEKVLDGLCRETGAQGGILWWLDEEGDGELRLMAAHGLVRVDEERERLDIAALPEAIRTERAVTANTDWVEPRGLPRPALLLALRRRDALVGVIRLTDKIGGERFDDVDRACAEKFVGFANTAYRNAERFHALERRTLQDSDTGAYRLEYLKNVLCNEIEKANRFGRRFGLLEISIAPIEPLRERLDEHTFRTWRASLARHLSRLLRATDLLATGGDGRFFVMLPESDAIGAATFKQRARAALEQGEPLAGIHSDVRPQVNLGYVSFPADARQSDALFRVLETRVADDRQARVRERHLATLPLADALSGLVEGAGCEPADTVASLLRFAVSEVGRRPRERNLLFCSPGETFASALAEGLRQRRDLDGETELVVLGEPRDRPTVEEGVTFVSPGKLTGVPPFAVHFGDGPAYVLVADESERASPPRLFHSSERSLAELLAFRLQRELRVPRLAQ